MCTCFSYTFFRGILFSVLVSVGLLVVGCDSGGSGGASGPDWVGTWEVTSVTYPSSSETDPSLTNYWNITKDTFTETTSRQFSGCVSSTGDEIDTDDNVLTYTQADGDGGTLEGKIAPLS
jgi:hypothetical protein